MTSIRSNATRNGAAVSIDDTASSGRPNQGDGMTHGRLPSPAFSEHLTETPATACEVAPSQPVPGARRGTGASAGAGPATSSSVSSTEATGSGRDALPFVPSFPARPRLPEHLIAATDRRRLAGSTVEERLLSRVAVDKDSGCWMWTGAVNESGYGRMRPQPNLSAQYAHRVAYELFVGPIPDGHLDHLCRVTRCVNPDHLEPVSPTENTRRQLQARDGHRDGFCLRGHEMTPENTYTRPSGSMECRQCRRLAGMERRSAVPVLRPSRAFRVLFTGDLRRLR